VNIWGRPVIETNEPTKEPPRLGLFRARCATCDRLLQWEESECPECGEAGGVITQVEES
jgi:rRNA maturation endonuclease Nob1